MKNTDIKPVIAALLLICGFAGMSHAESNYVDPKFQFGLRGGPALYSGGTGIPALVCPTAGLSLNWKLCQKPLYLQTGVWFNGQDDYDEDFAAAIKVPLTLDWHFRLTDNMAIGPCAGMYFAYVTGYATDNFNHFDMGVRIGGQFNYKKLYCSMGVDAGVLSRYVSRPYYSDIYVGTTVGFFTTIGVNFISR